MFQLPKFNFSRKQTDMTDDNMMVLRRSITTISTENLNSEIATNFVLIKEWMHLDDEDEDSEDFKLPRTVSLFDFQGNQLKIGRVKQKSEIGIDTDEEDIAIYATYLTDGAVHEMIHKFVRRGLEKFLEHRLEENDTSDEWDIEDKVKCVTDYILKTYVMDYYDSDEKIAVQVMKDVFGDIESRCGLGNPSYEAEAVKNITNSNPHLLIVNRKVQDVSPVIEKKKMCYPDGHSDWDASTYLPFDFEKIPDGVDVFQIVWAKK